GLWLIGLRPELCCSNTSLASLDSCQSLPVASTTAARSAAATASFMSSATNAFGAPSGRANPATLLLTAQAAREDLPKSSSSSRLSIAGLSAKRLRKQLSSWSLSRGK
uniref:Secreted protein n=2 Tax=Macrostomum lignano TaxID=282301 RepID=A0A1I8GYB7_9PLAT